MKKTKHQFHCNHCGNPCTIYKKGKGHRVLVCPHCGILATNPTLAGTLLKGAVSSIPVVGGIASSIVGAVQDSKTSPSKSAPTVPIVKDNKERFKYKEYLMHEALYGGRA
jgi:ribosomal protein S27E